MNEETTTGEQGALGKAKEVLNFGKKISKHWLLLLGAALFDLFGIIPFIGVVFNFIFGLILLIYFGPKSGRTSKIEAKAHSGLSTQSEFVKIGLPIILGSVIDFFVGILPVNIGAALIRIALS